MICARFSGESLDRSLRELLEVVETLKKRGIALLSLEEEIDTSLAAGELVFHVFGAIAQFERRLISERTRDGMSAARAKGSKPGRPALDQEKLSAALMLVKAACRQLKPRGKPDLAGQPSIEKFKADLTNALSP
jgi:DNA invertase Pin-like site-specific DNA recombinase